MSVGALPLIILAVYIAAKLPNRTITHLVKRKYPVTPLILLFVGVGMVYSLTYGILPAYAELKS